MLKKMVLLLCLSTCTLSMANRYESYVYEIEKDVTFGRLTEIAKRTDFAIEQIIKRSVHSLRDQGFEDEAVKIEFEFPRYKNYLSKMVAMRDIGDHAPLMNWLAITYEVIELKLGVESCKALHISDIKTINYCVPVVFKPCTFSMDSITIPRNDEYKKHFAVGDVYYGLLPVVTYWAVDIGCLAASSGAGSFLCGLAGSLGERFMANFVAPKVSDWVFSKACPAS